MEMSREEISKKVASALATPSIKDGRHSFVITDVTIEKKYSKFSETEEEFVNFHLENEDGHKVNKLDRLTGSKKGNLYKDMHRLGCLPKDNKKFDLNTLIGMEVDILVENITKDGVTYTNVVELSAVQVQKKKSPELPKGRVSRIQPKVDIAKKSSVSAKAHEKEVCYDDYDETDNDDETVIDADDVVDDDERYFDFE